MDAVDRVITKDYALYLGDCIEVMSGLPDASVDLSIYSPPFCGMYQYSSDERDLSNCLHRDEFFDHYGFVVDQIARLTKPGRLTAVHCADIPSGNTGDDDLYDLPGDIIRLHERHGWKFKCRYHVWKEPLTIRNRTMIKSLSHKTIVENATRCSVANADQLLIFRNRGKNAVPVTHLNGLEVYAGSRQMPNDAYEYRGWTGSQLENKYSHWIWRQYASAFWDDVRLDRVLPYREAKEEDDEKHVHPLQLDVIDRALALWSNPGEVVLTPFMGVGSEVHSAVSNGRKGLGIELKRAYWLQAVKNLESVMNPTLTQEAFSLSGA